MLQHPSRRVWCRFRRKPHRSFRPRREVSWSGAGLQGHENLNIEGAIETKNTSQLPQPVAPLAPSVSGAQV